MKMYIILWDIKSENKIFYRKFYFHSIIYRIYCVLVAAIVAIESPNWVKIAASKFSSSTVLSFDIAQANVDIKVTNSQPSNLGTSYFLDSKYLPWIY